MGSMATLSVGKTTRGLLPLSHATASRSWRRHSCLPRRDSSRRLASDCNARQAARKVWTRPTKVSAPRHGTEAGVTLIELVVVMAIVGLIVGITYPSVAAGL